MSLGRLLLVGECTFRGAWGIKSDRIARGHGFQQNLLGWAERIMAVVAISVWDGLAVQISSPNLAVRESVKAVEIAVPVSGPTS